MDILKTLKAAPGEIASIAAPVVIGGTLFHFGASRFTSVAPATARIYGGVFGAIFPVVVSVTRKILFPSKVVHPDSPRLKLAQARMALIRVPLLVASFLATYKITNSLGYPLPLNAVPRLCLGSFIGIPLLLTVYSVALVSCISLIALTCIGIGAYCYGGRPLVAQLWEGMKKGAETYQRVPRPHRQQLMSDDTNTTTQL